MYICVCGCVCVGGCVGRYARVCFCPHELYTFGNGTTDDTFNYEIIFPHVIEIRRFVRTVCLK